MKFATYDGEADALELASGRVLVKGVSGEVTEEEARFLSAGPQEYLKVTISDGPITQAPDDEEEADE